MCDIKNDQRRSSNISRNEPIRIMNTNILIKYFSVLSEITNKKKESFQLKSGQTVEELLQMLAGEYPEMSRYIPYIRVAVNQNYVPMDYQPSNDDEIVFITPVSGG